MDGLGDLAARLDSAADTVTGAGSVLAALDPGSTVFSAAAPGRLGATGRALHAQFARALAARSREAAGAAARLSDTAQALRWAAAGYLDIDDAARRRVRSREQ